MSEEAPSRNTRSKRNLDAAALLPDQNRRSTKRSRGNVAAALQSPQDRQNAADDDEDDDDNNTNNDDDDDDDNNTNDAADEDDASNRSVLSRSRATVADELICPITRELPYDPVTAADGRIYERLAIERHIANSRNQVLKSPLTNEPMGEQLLPAPQTKNLIQILIDGGVITGDLVEAWKKRSKQENDKAELIRKAEAGEAGSMGSLGYRYIQGCDGFRRDRELGYKWLKRAHDKGNSWATGKIGHCLVEGCGVEKDVTTGVMYITMAATRGSDIAALRLGLALAEGKYGIAANTHEAIQWLQRSLSPACHIKNLAQSARVEAVTKLRELKNQLTQS